MSARSAGSPSPHDPFALDWGLADRAVRAPGDMDRRWPISSAKSELCSIPNAASRLPSFNHPAPETNLAFVEDSGLARRDALVFLRQADFPPVLVQRAHRAI